MKSLLFKLAPYTLPKTLSEHVLRDLQKYLHRGRPSS